MRIKAMMTRPTGPRIDIKAVTALLMAEAMALMVFPAVLAAFIPFFASRTPFFAPDAAVCATC